MDQLAQLATDMLSHLGYWGLALGLFLDSFGPPIPSEVLLLLGGTLAATGRFELWAVFVIGIVAQVLGGLVGYTIGRYGGHPFLEKYGKYVLISKRDLKRTHAAFEKYGPWMAMLGRCVPVVRGLIAYPAGIAEMRLDLFIIYTTIGSTIWTALFVILGYTLGDNIEMVSDIFHQFTIIVVLAIIAAVVWHFRHPLQDLWKRLKGSSKAE
jgi:membrane protein DedA with SNARE-associated domain